MDFEHEIAKLKKSRGAILLAHNYQPAEVQAIADFTGDSLELARKAAAIESDVIVFAGVTFMAETAAALNPGKLVLMPDIDAGCPMADMLTAEQLIGLKAQHPGAKVLCYVNSSLEVKAESDCCCTSSNAYAVAKHYADQGAEIIFVPDQHLGKYTADRLGKKFILWPGYCPTHARITDFHVAAARAAHPGAQVMVHPECPEAIRRAADLVLSTGEMCREALRSSVQEYIVGTETGILFRLRQENPGKTFWPVLEEAVCPNMKKTTLEKVYWSLLDLQTPVRVDVEVAARARRSIDAMLAIA